jgi:hypothetical protein
MKAKPKSKITLSRLLKENKVLAKLLSLATSKSQKMKDELKKAKVLLKTMSVKCDKLTATNMEKNKTIDELRRQLAFLEDRYYVRLGASKGHKSFCEGSLPDDILQARYSEQKENEMDQEEEHMVNVSMLDQSNIIDLSRVNKNSVLKRKRNNKGSISILPKEKESLFKKAITPGKALFAGMTPSNFFRNSSQEDTFKNRSMVVQGMFEFENIDYREAFKIEESKAYLTQLAKELMMDTNSRAKFAFSKMKNKKYIDFGTLPTPVIKVERSLSCPSFTFSRRSRVISPKDADATLIFDKPGMQICDDYSLDCDFDELKSIIMKHPY